MEKGFMRTFLTFIKWLIIKLNSWPNTNISGYFLKAHSFLYVPSYYQKYKAWLLMPSFPTCFIPFAKNRLDIIFKGGENLIFQIYEVSARVKMFFNNNTFLTFVKEIYSSFLFSLSFLYFWTNLVLIRSLILI